MMTEDADRLALAIAGTCERGHEAGKHPVFTREGATALPVDQVNMRVDLQQAANRMDARARPGGGPTGRLER